MLLQMNKIIFSQINLFFWSKYSLLSANCLSILLRILSNLQPLSSLDNLLMDVFLVEMFIYLFFLGV